MPTDNNTSINNNAERQRRFRRKCKTTSRYKQINFWADYDDVVKFNKICEKYELSKKELFSKTIELIEYYLNQK